MSDKRDYYEVLGVSSDASVEDIRRAYKKRALKYHPDRNKGSKEAEQLFKEATEAYSVLSDDEKRGRYDRYGHAGLENSPGFSGDIFSHFQDIFSEFFGGFGGFGGGGGRSRRGGPSRGKDMRAEQRLDLEEAVLGCKKEIAVRGPVECSECHGSGAQPGTEPVRCGTCGGSGQVSTARGFIMFSQTCPTCRGEGISIEEYCERCEGAGWEEKTRTVKVTFPAGIDSGHRLRVAGQGMPGPRGGPPGDLYVDVAVEPHERFEREGNDLIARIPVSYAEAALGTKVPVELLDGSSHTFKIPSGSQPEDVISVRGKGAPRVDGRGTGALHGIVEVVVPKRISRRAKKLMRELDKELHGTAPVRPE